MLEKELEYLPRYIQGIIQAANFSRGFPRTWETQAHTVAEWLAQCGIYD